MKMIRHDLNPLQIFPFPISLIQPFFMRSSLKKFFIPQSSVPTLELQPLSVLLFSLSRSHAFMGLGILNWSWELKCIIWINFFCPSLWEVWNMRVSHFYLFLITFLDRNLIFFHANLTNPNLKTFEMLNIQSKGENKIDDKIQGKKETQAWLLWYCLKLFESRFDFTTESCCWLQEIWI